MSTSTASKNKWNDKKYERVYVTIPKGFADKMREHCRKLGASVNSVVFGEVKWRMGIKE